MWLLRFSAVVVAVGSRGPCDECLSERREDCPAVTVSGGTEQRQSTVQPLRSYSSFPADQERLSNGNQ